MPQTMKLYICMNDQKVDSRNAHKFIIMHCVFDFCLNSSTFFCLNRSIFLLLNRSTVDVISALDRNDLNSRGEMLKT